MAKDAFIKSKNDDLYRRIVDDHHDLICHNRPDGTLLFVNLSYARFFGKNRDDLIGSNFVNLIPKEQREAALKHLESFTPDKPTDSQEHAVIRGDGESRWVQWNNTAIEFDVNGHPTEFVGFGRDITEQRKTQTQMIQVSKLASLGEMATGIAHELNQPLNIIHMAAESLLEEAEDRDIPADILVAKLERIEGQVDRAAAIVNHLRAFGRKDSGELDVVDLKEAVQDTVGMVSELLRLSEIGLSVNLPETCRKVMGRRLQLEQVVLNLLTNARDAIEAYATDGNKPQRITVSIEDSPQSEEVSLSIQDSGGGIPDEVLDRIFEPFFTTKEVGKGTGLGLSISYSIITGMGGHIEVANVDEGARFTITLLAANDNIWKQANI